MPRAARTGRPAVLRAARAVVESVRRLARRSGFDIVPYPPRSAQSLTGHTAVLLRHLEIDCVLDVGANVGSYGESLRKLGYHGRIVSFEPVGDAFTRLAARCAGDERWSAVRLALGSVDGSRTMNVTAASVMASVHLPTSRAPRWLRPQLEVERTEEVPAARLDSVIETLGAPPPSRVFLKVDTQGSDLEVIDGAAGCLDRVVALQTEISIVPLYEGTPTWLDSLRLLWDKGFQPTWLTPVVTDGPIRALEFDCVMVRRDDGLTR